MSKEYLIANDLGYLLDLIWKIPLLTKAQERELTALAKEVNNPDKEIAKKAKEAKDLFVVSNMRLVINIARHYYRKGIELTDLVQEGTFGLIRAIEKFDPDRGFRFSTYATYWIATFISKAAQKSTALYIPNHANQKLNRYCKISNELMEAAIDTDLDRYTMIKERMAETTLQLPIGTTLKSFLNKYPNRYQYNKTSCILTIKDAMESADITDLLDMFPDRYDEANPDQLLENPTRVLIAKAVQRSQGGDRDFEQSEELYRITQTFFSLEDSVGESNFTFGDIIVEEESAGMEEKTQLREDVEIGMKEALNDKEFFVLKARYGLFDSDILELEKISEVLGITKERIRQIESTAAKKLRAYFKETEYALHYGGRHV